MQPLTYAAVVVRARRGGPTARGLARQLDVYRAAGERVDSLVDNPTLSLLPGARTHPEGDRGFELQASLTQPIRLHDVPGSRRAWARAAADRAAVQADTAARARVQRAAELWLSLWRVREVLAVLGESHDVTARFVERTRAGADRGLFTRADVARAEAFFADLGIEVLRVRGEAHELGLALAAHLGQPRPTPLAAEGPPPPMDLPASRDLRWAAERLGRAPGVRAASAEVAVARARSRSARVENAPPLGLGVAVQREAPNALVAFVTASLQLPLFDQGTVPRAQADAAVEGAMADRDRARLAAAHVLARLTHEVLHRRQTEAAVRDQLMPPLVRQRSAAERLLSVGEGTVLDVLRARRDALAGRRRLLSAQAARLSAEQQLSLFLESLGELP